MENEIVKQDFFSTDRLDKMVAMAEKFFKARCFGGNIQNAEQMLVIIQAGFEMGMQPVEALNSLYIVSGKITIYGAAMSKRLRVRGWNIQYEDSGSGQTASCKVTITKGDETHTYTATAAELMLLNSKAFKFAPKEKIRWHALSRLIRFEVPEVLDAGISYLQEEMMDVPTEKAKVEVIQEPIVEPVRPHLVALQKELQGRGATTKAQALNILNSTLGLHSGTLDYTEQEASGLLIQLLLCPKVSEAEVEIKTPINETKEPTRDNAKYYTASKVREIVLKLEHKEELDGFEKEIETLYEAGEITQTIASKAMDALKKKRESLLL